MNPQEVKQSLINPKKPYHYKWACHKLMEEVFGKDKFGRASAYQWLRRNFGETIHFANINDEVRLKEIWERLYAYSFKHGQYAEPE